MTPREFYNDVVIPNLAEFESKYDDIRLCHNAVGAVDSLAAHIYFFLRSNQPNLVSGIFDDSGFRHHLANQHSDFGLLRDVAKALKHVELTRHTPEVRTANQIAIGRLGFGEARFGEGRFGSPPQIVVTTNGGDKRVMETVIKSSAAFLENQMTAFGI